MIEAPTLVRSIRYGGAAASTDTVVIVQTSEGAPLLRKRGKQKQRNAFGHNGMGGARGVCPRAHGVGGRFGGVEG